MAPGRVLLQRQGAVARIVLSHPGKLNAMSRAMWRELREAFRSLAGDAALRCAVVAGEGEAFCAGGDISEYAGFRFEEASLRDFHEADVWGGLQAVLDCDLPVVACIRGACMGAGVEIASACDLRIAADDARFGAPIARLGFPMAPQEAELVRNAAGEGTLREMLLAAAVLPAGEMKSRGFLHETAAPGRLQERCDDLASRIAALSPLAARLNKRTLRALRERHDPARGALAQAELQRAYDYAPHPEHREGVAAFLDKRKPAFE